MTPVISAARPEERAAALRLAFAQLPTADREERVAGLLDALRRGELDPAGVLVIGTGAGLLAAAVAAPLPGRAAALWPPQVAPGVADADALADALAAHAVAWLKAGGARVAQAVLPPEESAAARPLLRAGLSHATSLWYLRHFLDLSAPDLGAPGRLRLATFAASDPDLFRETLSRTFAGTRDFPELNGARPADDVLAGYQAGGGTDLWWLARAGAEPVGVLLAHPAPDWGGWDVAYVGVVPEARRRGVGAELLRHALVEAKTAGQPHVTLAVDARNAPALALYRRRGFEPFERREVFLAVWADDR